MMSRPKFVARRRATWGLPLALLFSACAENKPPSYYQPGPPAAMQEPAPGQALLFLFRAPHDAEIFQMDIDGKLPFELTPDSYTVLSFMPGEYGMKGWVVGRAGARSPAFEPARFKLQAGQRLYLYVSGTNDSSIFLNGLTPISRRFVLVDGGIRPSTVAGTRSWKECSEIDAQGFIAISRRLRFE